MDQVYNKAAKGFSLLLILRIFSRIIDFILNVFIVSDIDPNIYGLTIHFGLLYNLILFYSKNSLKNSYQRRINKDGANELTLIKSAQNLMFFGVLATIILALFFGFLWSYLYGYLYQYFNQTIFLFCTAAIFDAMAEPFYVQAILNFDYEIVAKSELISVFLKTLTLFVLTHYKLYDSLANFGIAQLVFSVLLVICAYYFSNKKYKEKINLFPKIIDNSFYVHKDMKDMGIQFTLLSFMKLLLQEIEKIVMVNFQQSPQQAAEFSLVSHIGGMIPLYIYAPIEQIAYNMFSKLDELQAKEKILKQRELLEKVLRFMTIIGFSCIFFGTPLSKSFLITVYGEKWAEDTCVLALQLYCFYEFCMGLNGITESFVTGSLQINEVSNYRTLVGISTLFYIGICVYLSKYGASGLVLANILSFAVRIGINFYYIVTRLLQSKIIFNFLSFIDKKDRKQFLKNIFPSRNYTILYILFSLICCTLVQKYQDNYKFNIMIGGFLMSIASCQIYNRYGNEYRALFAKKKKRQNADYVQVTQQDNV